MKTHGSKTILHVIGQMERGGAERQLIKVTQGLIKKGWQVHVVTFSVNDTWAGKIRDMGIEVHSISRSWNPARRLVDFASAVWQSGPALIHSWSHHTNLYAGAFRLLSSIPLIVSFRGNPMINNVSGAERRSMRFKWVYERADCVLSNSRAALTAAGRAGVKLRAEALVGNIVESRMKAEPGANAVPIRIVAVGSLKPIKGHEVLIRSIGILAKEGFQCDLSIAGEGPERRKLEALIKQLNLELRVHLMGEIEDVHSLMASAHILVQPSFMEGLSNSVLEAMAAGLPVIATDVGAIPEYICHGETGYLVPPRDVSAVTDHLRKLLSNSALRVALGTAALNEVQKRCREEEVIRQYEKAYNMLLGTTVRQTGITVDAPRA